MTATTETTTVQTDLYINGEHRSTPETIDVPDPAKPGRIVGRAASASKDDVAEAVASAKAAAASWGKLSAAERAEHMRTAIAGIADNRDEDARILSQENGKIVQEAWSIRSSSRSVGTSPSTSSTRWSAPRCSTPHRGSPPAPRSRTSRWGS